MAETPMSFRPDFTPEQEEWIATRPPAVQEKVRQFHPEALYRLKTTGQLATIEAYESAEDDTCETCRVTAWQEWAPESTARSVFGIRFTDLSPVVDG